MMKILLAFMLLAPAVHAADTASPDDVKLVQLFLKTPVAELPPEAVDHFLSIDAETLPKKLQKRFEAKRIELYTLKHLAEGKKKGAIRTPDPDCAAPQDTQSSQIGVLHMAGYGDLTEEEEQCIEQKSHCTERDLMCEFSLQIVVTPEDKKLNRRHLLLHGNDPINSYLVTCRPGAKVGGQTNFFGLGGPICSH